MAALLKPSEYVGLSVADAPRAQPHEFGPEAAMAGDLEPLARHGDQPRRLLGVEQLVVVGFDLRGQVRGALAGNSSFADKRRERQILRKGVGAEG